MSIDPESLEVGQCYLTVMGTVRRVVHVLDQRVQYQQRAAHRPDWRQFKAGILDLRSFAFTVERPVPEDWSPETGRA